MSNKLIAVLIAVMVGLCAAPVTASGLSSTRKMTRPGGPAGTLMCTQDVPGVKGATPILSGSSDGVQHFDVVMDITALNFTARVDGRIGKSAGDKDKKPLELVVASRTLGVQVVERQDKATEKKKSEDTRWSGFLFWKADRNWFPLGEIVEVRLNTPNDQNIAAITIRRIDMTYAEVQFGRLAAAGRIPPGTAPPMGGPRMAAPNGPPPFPAQVGGPQGQGEPVEQQVGRPHDEPFRKEPFKLKSTSQRNDASASGSRRPDVRQVQPAPTGDNFTPGAEDDDQEDPDEDDNRPATQPRRQSTPRQAPRVSREQPRESEEPAATGRRVSSSTSRVLPRRQGPASCKLVIDLKRSRDEGAGQDLTLYVYIEGKFVKRITIGSDESQYTTEVPAGELTVKLGRADAESWVVGKFSAEIILPGNTWHVTLKEM